MGKPGPTKKDFDRKMGGQKNGEKRIEKGRWEKGK
jgi:hypothetical protein